MTDAGIVTEKNPAARKMKNQLLERTIDQTEREIPVG
jgi:hypothetical protein